MLNRYRCLWLVMVLVSAFFVKATAHADQSSWSVPTWSSISMLNDIPCHDLIPDYRFKLTSEYSYHNAMILMISSWLGHSRDVELVRQQLAQWGFTRIFLLGKDEKGARGYVAEHQDFIFASFRGTELQREDLENALFFQTSAQKIGMPGNVHFGMYLHFDLIREELDKAMNQINAPHKPLIMSGHSRGGSTALLAALYRQQQGDKVLALYTFGQPLVGDETFRAYAESQLVGNYFRIANLADLTPHVPPSASSAREFSQVLSRYLPQTAAVLYRTVKHLNYGMHPGQAYTFGEQQTLQRDIRPEAQIEADFWVGMQKQVNELKTPGGVKDIFMQRLFYHHPHQYICGMLDPGLLGKIF